MRMDFSHRMWMVNCSRSTLRIEIISDREKYRKLDFHVIVLIIVSFLRRKTYLERYTNRADSNGTNTDEVSR